MGLCIIMAKTLTRAERRRAAKCRGCKPVVPAAGCAPVDKETIDLLKRVGKDAFAPRCPVEYNGAFHMVCIEHPEKCVECKIEVNPDGVNPFDLKTSADDDLGCEIKHLAQHRRYVRYGTTPTPCEDCGETPFFPDVQQETG